MVPTVYTALKNSFLCASSKNLPYGMLGPAFFATYLAGALSAWWSGNNLLAAFLATFPLLHVVMHYFIWSDGLPPVYASRHYFKNQFIYLGGTVLFSTMAVAASWALATPFIRSLTTLHGFAITFHFVFYTTLLAMSTVSLVLLPIAFYLGD